MVKVGSDDGARACSLSIDNLLETKGPTDVFVPDDLVVQGRGGEHVEVAVAVEVGGKDSLGAVGIGQRVDDALRAEVDLSRSRRPGQQGRQGEGKAERGAS